MSASGANYRSVGICIIIYALYIVGKFLLTNIGTLLQYLLQTTGDFRACIIRMRRSTSRSIYIYSARGAKTAAHAPWPREVCIYVLSIVTVVGVVLRQAGGEAVEIVLSKSLQCQVVFLWKSTEKQRGRSTIPLGGNIEKR